MKIVWSVVVLGVLSFGGAANAQWTFEPLSVPPNAQTNFVVATNSDASVILVSASAPGGRFYYRWRDGLIDVIDLQGWSPAAISYDGNAITGGGDRGAFHWTESGGVQDLSRILPPGWKRRFEGAMAIADDGQSILGTSVLDGHLMVIRWHTNGTFETAGYCGSSSLCIPNDAAGDLSAFVGGAFPWGYVTSGTSSICLPFVPHYVSAVSEDGSVVAGSFYERTQLPQDVGLFRFANGLMETISELPHPSGDSPLVSDMSGDGSVIVGSSGCRAFIWSRGSGTVDLGEELRRASIDISGWELGRIVAITRDGQSVVGEGFSPEGRFQPWKVRLALPDQPRCHADWNQDGFLDSQDFFDFLIAFFSGRGNYDGCNGTNSSDFFSYITDFFTGCP